MSLFGSSGLSNGMQMGSRTPAPQEQTANEEAGEGPEEEQAEMADFAHIDTLLDAMSPEELKYVAACINEKMNAAPTEQEAKTVDGAEIVPSAKNDTTGANDRDY